MKAGVFLMRVAVVGAGYVGLVSGICFAAQGKQVTCIDVNKEKIVSLQQGICTIFEPKLGELLIEQLATQRIRFVYEWPDKLDIDLVMIGVGTPSRPDGSADLSNVFAVVLELASRLKSGVVICTKSTVPVGTGEAIKQLLSEMGRDDLHVTSAPEFLREGSAVEDTLRPSRLIFGAESQEGFQTLRELYGSTDAPIIECDRRTAEMIKYASNAFLATKISFINEIANICDLVNTDVSLVAKGMGYDTRIGESFLRAGLGYGGSCFPKDTRALVNIAGELDYDFKLLKAVIEINSHQRLLPLRQLREWYEDLKDKIIVLYGIAFKPGTDDTRETPALELVKALIEEGAHVRLCDPVVKRFVIPEIGEMSVMDDAILASKGAHAIILVTEWREFIELDWKLLRTQTESPFLFDGRNVLDPKIIADAGFILSSIGRATTRVPMGVV